MKLFLLLLLSLHAVIGFSPLRPCLEQTTRLSERYVNKKKVADDMIDAGHAEKESKDWVADEMNRLGKAGAAGHKNWIAEDMKDAGEAGTSHTPSLKQQGKKHVETQGEKLAKSLASVGKDKGTDDWIARDMKLGGQAGSKEEMHVDQLERALDKKHDTGYDDIYDDMKKTGQRGSTKTALIAEEMRKTGMAESLFNFYHDVSYKIDKWTLKAFNTDQIIKDMTIAGQARDESWIAHDMEVAGRTGAASTRKPPPKSKDLTDNESSNWVIRDMMRLGKAATSWLPRPERMSGKKMDDLIANDMKATGTMSDGWVKGDMETTGHAESRSGQPMAPHISHKKRESEYFMSSRPVKMAPVSEEDLDYMDQAIEEQGEEALEQVEHLLEHVALEQVQDLEAAEEAAEAHGIMHFFKNHFHMPHFFGRE